MQTNEECLEDENRFKKKDQSSHYLSDNSMKMSFFRRFVSGDYVFTSLEPRYSLTLTDGIPLLLILEYPHWI